METIDGARGGFRLLFVCTGNTCRSPMAEVIARRAVAELGWQNFEVRSAGIAALDGDRASGGAVRAATRSGLDLSEHSATLLTSEVVEWADLVLVMSMGHLSRVGELGRRGNAALVTSFGEPQDAGGTGSVPDPIGGPDEHYLETFEFLEQLIPRAVQRLERDGER
jgi:protein-tyrosine-phosphatase